MSGRTGTTTRPRRHPTPNCANASCRTPYACASSSSGSRGHAQAIAAGTYGICVDCGAPIPEGRLHAIPDAERCVSCQSIAARRR